MGLEDHSAACPKCGEALYRKRRGEWSLVAKILTFSDDGAVTAKCERCGDPVPVPFLMIRDGRIRPMVRRRVVDNGDPPE